jgi:hypothetical protein
MREKLANAPASECHREEMNMGAPRRPPQFRVVYSDAGLAVGEIERMCVAVWRGEVTTRRFRQQQDTLRDVVTRGEGLSTFLCVIEPTAIPPNDELRRASTDMVLSFGDQLKCVACVIEGTGFKAAITRGVLSGMVLLLRNRRVEITFCTNVVEAAKWIGKIVPLDFAEDIPQLVNRFRSTIPSPAR